MCPSRRCTSYVNSSDNENDEGKGENSELRYLYTLTREEDEARRAANVKIKKEPGTEKREASDKRCEEYLRTKVAKRGGKGGKEGLGGAKKGTPKGKMGKELFDKAKKVLQGTYAFNDA